MKHTVSYNVTVHIYQKNILDLLRQATALRYSQMQPDDVESGHFKYHLNLLVKDGLVERKDRGLYALSGKGKAAVDRLSRGRVNPHLTPKVITYTLLEDEQNYYLYRKDKEPYLGLINMIGGKVHLGEPAGQAAKREVYEKTGLSVPEPVLRGIAEIRIKNNENLLSHVIAYVYVAELGPDTRPGNGLIPIPVGSLPDQAEAAPDLLEVFTAVRTSKSLFALDIDIVWPQ